MTDNTGEEISEKEANKEPENTPDDTNTDENDITIIAKQAENMEVHKHPHHVMHKKKWKEYLLEFFMLFLAVFLGFLAENWREQLVERNKAKEYMHALVVDLKTDTSIINETVRYNANVFQSDSTLLTLLTVSLRDPQTLHKIYQLCRATQNFDFQTNDSKTRDQLKSTGDYRLIKNRVVLDSMAKYYQQINLVTFYRDEIQQNLQLTYNLSFKIFDLYTFENSQDSIVPIISTDPAVLKEYNNKLYNCMESYKSFNRYLLDIKSRAVDLISIINKEYPGDE